MTKIAAISVLVVVVAELVAFAVLDRELVLVVVGAMVALVLVTLRWRLVADTRFDDDAAAVNDPAELLRRWLSRTETLISRAESSRRDWDRHLRPMLARQFEMATGQTQAKNRSAFTASGHMLFGADLWAWVDPQNVAPTDAGEPGPGREVLDEILRRLEQV